jgi:hypothetical protein
MFLLSRFVRNFTFGGCWIDSITWPFSGWLFGGGVLAKLDLQDYEVMFPTGFLFSLSD